ncbi:hypothetical protein E2562_009486 [Oryza meyeriana var. granulata]|uniref:Protein TIFY n=1 Tax=Oryza meyeriana var. granulata TaxID=110450 RepID=A0A6G1BV90_9ORYZ|nr:hypothetical protein E2562_009486 [Oryza meyeriana var. granulata]
MAMASKDPITRRFAVACGVLSQYVKANSPQSAAAPGVTALMAATAPVHAAAVQEPEPAGGEQQFTMFYAGRVVVIDRCTPSMAAELIRYASAAQSSAPEPPALVDMPIARKASLQRFLAKRKDRSTASARSPYGRPAAEEQPPAKKEKAEERREDWLALGSLADMHSR